MGTLSNFLGAQKEIEINGTKIILKPLKVKDLVKFAKTDMSDEEKSKVGKELLLLSIEGTTMEEINELPMETFTLIMEEINELNGFKDQRVGEIEKRLGQLKERKSNN